MGHLRNRAKERQISEEDLFELAEWKLQDPSVPDGDWYKDFGTFKLCGTGRLPSTFLLAGQTARGVWMSKRQRDLYTVPMPPHFISRQQYSRKPRPVLGSQQYEIA